MAFSHLPVQSDTIPERRLGKCCHHCKAPALVETKQLLSRSGGTSKKKSSKKSKKTNALAALSASSSTNEAPTKKEIAIAAATASTIEEVKEESTLRTSADSVDLVCIGDLLCTHMI